MLQFYFSSLFQGIDSHYLIMAAKQWKCLNYSRQCSSS